jgi:hypothetical protein
MFSPIDGSAITHNVSAAARSRVNTVDGNEDERPQDVVQRLEHNFNARLPRGMTLFGGG